MTSYEAKVQQIQDCILQALTTQTTPQGIAATIQTHVFTEDPDKLLPTSARELLSHALQASVIHLVSNAAAANQPSLQYSLPSTTTTTTNTQPVLPSLLQASLVFCANGDTKDLALIQLPSLLVELISEASPAVQFEDLLSWLHSQLHTFQAPPYVDRSKLPMLRTCNMLLRRLSKGANASLCGRILMFLAKFLSLTERSGVNLKGEYNTSNKTPIEQFTTTITGKREEEGEEEKKEKKASDNGNGDKKKKRKHQDTEDATDGEDVPLDAEGNPVDKEFYQIFWRLQDAFSNPPSVLASNEKWSQVVESIRKTLQHFRKEKVTVGEGSHSHNNSAGTGNGQQQQQDISLGIKYLSSARLMSLQFKEAAFRRHIIVQALILFHYLEKPYMKNPPPPRPKSTGSGGGGGDKKGEGNAKGEDTGDGSGKEKQDPAKAGGLSGRQLNELRELKNSLLAELDATPDNGATFTSSIQHLLRAEDHWAAWKQANCPADPLQRRPIPPLKDSDLDGTEVGPIRKKRRPSSHLQAYGIRVGTEDLDRLWNLTEDNITSLGADDRGGFKTVAQLIEPVIDEMKEGGDGEDSMFGGGGNSGIYAWKTLRFVARDQLTAFVKTVQKGGDLRVAARALFPDECPPEPEPEPEVVVVEEKEEEAKEEKFEEEERKGEEEEREDVVMVPAIGEVEEGGRGEEDKKKEDGVDDHHHEEEVDYGDDDDDEGGKERGREEEERKEEEEKEGGEEGDTEHSGEDMDVDTDHKVQEGNDNDNENDKDKNEGKISNKEEDKEEGEEEGALKSKGYASGNTTSSSSDDEEGEVN